jgi:pheromone shutdown protein TraB
MTIHCSQGEYCVFFYCWLPATSYGVRSAENGALAAFATKSGSTLVLQLLSLFTASFLDSHPRSQLVARYGKLIYISFSNALLAIGWLLKFVEATSVHPSGSFEKEYLTLVFHAGLSLIVQVYVKRRLCTTKVYLRPYKPIQTTFL